MSFLKLECATGASLHRSGCPFMNVHVHILSSEFPCEHQCGWLPLTFRRKGGGRHKNEATDPERPRISAERCQRSSPFFPIHGYLLPAFQRGLNSPPQPRGPVLLHMGATVSHPKALALHSLQDSWIPCVLVTLLMSPVSPMPAWSL